MNKLQRNIQLRPLTIALLLAVLITGSAAAQGSNVDLTGRWLSGPCASVAVNGSYAYFAGGTHLAIADITTPGAPVELSRFPLPAMGSGVATSGNYVFVACIEAGVRVIDVSAPDTPVEAGFYVTPGHARAIVIDGVYAYVADRHAGLLILDISTPSAPTML